MPDRFLVAVATIVLLVAMLVGVVLGVPLFLTEEGIDVNAGLIVTGAAALGTVGALVWASSTGLSLEGKLTPTTAKPRSCATKRPSRND